MGLASMQVPCPSCGSAQPSDASFCGVCGGNIKASASSPGRVRTPVPAQMSNTGEPMVVAAPALEDGQIPVGAMVGEYQITGLVGEGGMGTVYAGIHPLIEKKVAIKVLKPQLSREREVMERFLAEARAANKIGHPNIIDVFAFGCFPDGSQYFVMEYLAGRSLSALLEGGKPIEYRDAQTILNQTLDALEAAHARGIVHRDLKPDNIFLVERAGHPWVIKLLDFGIAKFTDDAGLTGHTRTGVPMGTPIYMAPEQCQGRNIDHRADIYALGIILYQLFTGRVPFSAPSFYEVISAHLTKEPDPPSNFAELPPELETIILKCLKKDAAERYQTVGELRTELMPIIDAHAGAGTAAPTVMAKPPVRKAAGSGKGKVIGIAAALVVIAGGAVGFVVMRGQAGGAPPVAQTDSRPAEPAETPPEQPPQPPVAVPEVKPDAGPQMVTIQFLITPHVTKYQLLVDDKKLDKPMVTLPASSEKYVRVKLLADGYQPYEQEFLPMSSMPMQIMLVKKGSGRSGSRSGSSSSSGSKSDDKPRVNRIDDL